ncbi:protein PAT1 homolog 1-like isoform X2 [Dendronephthya gigantea]|uniref:protein PAT1 homolog 1-like isoform X2 n=1 Tax=Dendronephthya gigantea TaxID=151771 RepID=UPI00106951B3|nr:protein PAT1 homolog 1-like isoform X2 [Dendronephthya gigantea]
MADSSSSKLAEQAYSDEISFKSNMLFPMPLEENENLDSLNDETFGSGSFDSEWVDSDKPDKMVDEFEQWKKQQKAISKKGIPLDEAPLQIPSEEKMAQAISKLDNLGIATPKLEQEDPLPNAHAIEALWPTSPKHSSNIVSPDHSPYHMTDLLSPTHNIWGSPTSDEKISIDMDEKLADHTKNCLDQEDNRKPFSPVLEDEAIVSALPKRISKPIRVEDVEKMGFGHQVNQLPPHLRPFANGVPKVRPPPGFPPNMNPRSPFPMHPPGPYGPPPIPAVPQNVAQAQAQALYTAMMNQRMPFPQPFPRTPPSQPPHFPRPVYHSDPGHLRQRGPPMPIPHQHGRFITPQPRNTWNNQRVGRNQDNRRRQQNFSESPGLKYIPQYYVSSDDDDEGDKGTLMTAKEKDWIIRIQLMQLTSDKPELDDYYFHTFERRRLAKERSQSTTGVELETNHTNKDIKMTLPHVTKGDHNYKPTKFEGSLGQVSVGSVFHPREVVQVGDSGKPKGPGFDQILPIEDLERMVLQVPQDVRPQLRERRERLCQRCFDLVNLTPSKDSNKKYDDDTLIQMLSVRKGRRFLSKILRLVRENQRNEIALAITRNLRVFAKKNVHQEETDSLCDGVSDVIRSSPDRIIEHHHNVVGNDNSVIHLFSSRFTLRILTILLKTLSELSKNIGENSLQIQTVWLSFLSVVCQDFVSSSPKVLIKNYTDVQNIVDILSNNVDDDKLLVIREHFRLLENADIRSPQR